MSKDKDDTEMKGVLMDTHTEISFVEVCQTFQVSEAFLTELIEHGLFKPSGTNIKKLTFDYHTVSRIQSAKRMQQDLGINTAGVVLALELLEELQQVRDELTILRRLIDEEI